MSEQTNHNDPLEEFFRDKAQDYDIEYREEDWQKLEARLDQADQLRSQRFRRRLVAAAVILLFAVLGYITYDQQQEINLLNDKLSSREHVSPPPASSDSTPGAATPDNAGAQNVPQDQQLAQEKNPPATEAADQPENAAKPGNGSHEEHSEQSTRQFAAMKELTEKRLATAKASPGFDGRYPAISAIKPVKFAPSSLTGNKPASENTADKSQTSPLLASRKAPRFSVSLMGGPDLSTVGGMSQFRSPGHKYGIAIEYYLTDNLAISAGAQRSKVRYQASGSEYGAPNGYFQSSTPSEVYGRCILIDIPINLKYEFWNFDRSRLYATAGLSSYVMLDEDYQFEYDNAGYSTSNKKQRWHERTGTGYWMSNATLSVGYELDMSRNVSLRAAPFVKLPLKGVGWGDVNLYSLGSFFSINYKIR